MAHMELLISQGRAVLTLTNAEGGNSFGEAFTLALRDAVQALEARRDYRTLIVRAEGPHFCVGGSIDAFDEATDFPQHLRETLPEGHSLFARLFALPLPIIVAIQGSAAGGGLGLALGADILVASDKAVFRSGYPAIGISPDLGASYQVIRRAGPTFAMMFLMSNRKVSSQEALAAGLITEVVAHETLDARVEEIADELSRLPRSSLAAIKRLVSFPGESLTSHMAREEAEIMACAASPDAAEGIRAFLEKRPPRFE